MPFVGLVRYGVLGLPLAFGALPVYLFVPDLYARMGVLSLTTIGVVLLLTRLLDAIVDPFFGVIADRYSRRTLLVSALIFFSLGFLGLFSPTAAMHIDPAVWFFLTLTCCTLGFSAALIAYQAWGGDLGADPSERLRLTGAREAFMMIGVLTASIIPTFVADDLMVGMQRLPLFLLPLLLLSALVFFWRSKSPKPTFQESLHGQFRKLWLDLIYRRLLLINLFNGIASAFPATLFVFYVSDVLGAPELSGVLLGVYFLAAALAVPFCVRLSQLWGRPQVWMMSMLLAMLAFAGAAFLGDGDWPWFLAVCLFSGIAVGTDLTVPSSMVADLGESRGAAGTYFGIWNLVAKLNLAVAAGIALPLLSLLGYQPGDQSQREVLVAVYVLLPLGIKSLALLLLYRWRRQLTIAAQDCRGLQR